MQVDAFGPNDSRCFVTSDKITMLQKSEGEGELPIKLDEALKAIPRAEEPTEKPKKGKFRFMPKRKKNSKASI